MRSVIPPMRRLYTRGPNNCGFAADEDGLVLGPDCQLIWRSDGSYRVAQPETVAVIEHVLMGSSAGPSRLSNLLNLIADALTPGELAKAQLLALQFPISESNNEQLRKLQSVLLLLKAGFDPDEPRDEAGRWTDAGTSAAPSSLMPGFIPAAFHLPELPDGHGQALNDAIYQGEYHDFLVEHLADITRKAGGTAIESVRLIGVTGDVAVADLLVKPVGWPSPFIIEVKTGDNPTLSYNQARVYALALIGGHVTSIDPAVAKLGLIPGTLLPRLPVLTVYTRGPGEKMYYKWLEPDFAKLMLVSAGRRST